VPGSLPTDSSLRVPQLGDLQRTIFLSGRVMLDDGTPPPVSVTIMRVCFGNPQPQAYTDAKGRFNFELGRSFGMVPDASMDSQDVLGPRTAGSGDRDRAMGDATQINPTRGCELQAYLPGYRSDSVDLTGRRSMDNPDVGTILLHRLANVEGSVISALSLRAPKDARKAYEKGFAALTKAKWDEAETHLEQAVALYPQYPDAWFSLGAAFQNQGKLEEARKAYGKAISADDKFLKPYRQMAEIALHDRNWEEVARTTDRLLRLDPVDYPEAYFFNAVARFNLGDVDAAEKSAREGLRLDPNHHIPKLEHLLGTIRAKQRDYAGAAQLYRSYLDHQPDGKDAELVRKQVADLDRLAAQSASQAQPGR
jgi:tetratricopeptide (TPR) repeat protein